MLSLDKLKNIDTPARYTGGEARQYIKNSATITNRICIAVPAMYEVGMFDFDLKDLYYVLNSRKDTWCERVFSPMLDFEQLLRENDEPLYTLESKTSLKNMDAIIVVLSSEMMYTNFLNMLNLGKIPILKERRKEGFPLIIATGSAITNPKPLEKFVDMFVIGEASCIANDIAEILKRKDLTKDDMIMNLSKLQGVYVPELTISEVHMVSELDIDSGIVPKNMVVPSIKTMIDKSLVMVSRGCEKNCIMCAHKYAYGTPDYMSVDKALSKTKTIMEATGNNEVMLMSNCYATYPGFPDIIYKLKDLDRPKVKDISFMEVKLRKDNLWLLKYLNDKNDYPGIIVGGATKKLREKIGIEIEDDDVEYIAKEVFEAGFNKIRLKYIIGIPGETYEDFAKILNMANKICKVYKEVYSKSPDKYIVELNLYTFKPKPHTPSAWCPMNTAESLELKQRYLKEKNKNENVIMTYEKPEQSVIETMIARGDNKVSDVIYEAWKQGARHDMIEPLFSNEAWQLALNKTGVDIKEYLEAINEKIVLPWDNINVKTTKDELRRMYINKVKGD